MAAADKCVNSLQEHTAMNSVTNKSKLLERKNQAAAWFLYVSIGAFTALSTNLRKQEFAP